MANLLIVCFAALAIVGSQAAILSPFGFAGVPGLHPGNQRGPERPMKLTCAANFTDHYRPEQGIAQAIAITISSSSGRRSAGPHSLFSLVGGGTHGHAGLEANIEIFSVTGGRVAVAFTQRSRPERGCMAEDFGDFMTGQSSNGLLGSGGAFSGLGYGLGAGAAYGGGYGLGSYGLGGYGQGGYGQGGLGLAGYGLAGYGLGGYGSPYGAVGGLVPHAGHALGGEERNMPGVIATVQLTPGVASKITIDNLDGFTSMNEIAGRGAVICPADAVDTNYGSARCEGGILACCSMHFDNEDQSLYVDNGARDSGYGAPRESGFRPVDNSFRPASDSGYAPR